MTEVQPDMLGGKAVPASRLKRRSVARVPIKRHGWAAQPGSGPKGKTCGTCSFACEYRFKNTYLKCSARPGEHWKGGRETDIRPMDPACSKWDARIKEERRASPPPAAPPPSPVAPPTPQATRKPDDDRQTTFGW